MGPMVGKLLGGWRVEAWGAEGFMDSHKNPEEPLSCGILMVEPTFYWSELTSRLHVMVRLLPADVVKTHTLMSFISPCEYTQTALWSTCTQSAACGYGTNWRWREVRSFHTSKICWAHPSVPGSIATPLEMSGKLPRFPCEWLFSLNTTWTGVPPTSGCKLSDINMLYLFRFFLLSPWSSALLSLLAMGVHVALCGPMRYKSSKTPPQFHVRDSHTTTSAQSQHVITSRWKYGAGLLKQMVGS